ncbi:MAG: SsrA-binding protein [Chloroflexi bacterium CG15_BIG_FIL_POST_REV_8_21_14_020_46_15]|nr:MAG: SsrA-binding protein [Chloroflexi bacterium CG15_BIG_FIL_POST_REV_8_21_14_020_46_15]
MTKNSGISIVNRKAYHDYRIEESLEVGIVLKGSEIKSIREGKVSLRDAYAKPENGELWLFNSHIASYDAASYNTHQPTRTRKLLLHKEEIDRLTRKVAQRGLTLVPLKLYIKHGIAKVEIGVGKGKKIYDKREVIVRRETERQIDRALKIKGRW